MQMMRKVLNKIKTREIIKWVISGKALLDLGDEVTELYDQYHQQFVDYCKEVFDVGAKHYAERQIEIDHFTKSVEKTKKNNQTESIGYMESFLGKWKSDENHYFHLVQRSIRFLNLIEQSVNNVHLVTA